MEGIISVGAVIIAEQHHGGDLAAVPEVAGLPLEEAVAAIEQIGLRPC